MLGTGKTGVETSGAGQFERMITGQTVELTRTKARHARRITPTHTHLPPTATQRNDDESEIKPKP